METTSWAPGVLAAAAVAVAVALTVGPAGCSSPADAPGSRPTSPAPLPASSTRDPRSYVEGAVLAAVDGFVASTIAANDPPDPSHPDLARYRSGEVLVSAIEAVDRNRSLGIAYRRGEGALYDHEARVVSFDDARAEVLNCIVDDAVQVEMSTGRVVDDAVATKRFRTILESVDGGWKVVANELLEAREGAHPCAGS